MTLSRDNYCPLNSLSLFEETQQTPRATRILPSTHWILGNVQEIRPRRVETAVEPLTRAQEISGSTWRRERHLISEANFLYFQKLSICTSSYLNDVNTETFTFILTNHITRHWFKARSPSKTTLAGIFQRRIFWKRIFNRFIEL